MGNRPQTSIKKNYDGLYKLQISNGEISSNTKIQRNKISILWIFKCVIPEKGFIKMDQIFFKNVQQLWLISCGLKGDDMRFLSKSHLPILKKMYIYNEGNQNKNSIGSKGVKYIVQSRYSNLELLQLADSSIGDQGVILLALAHLPALTKLFVNQSYDVTLVGIKSILKSEIIVSLQWISLAKTMRVTSEVTLNKFKKGIKFDVFMA